MAIAPCFAFEPGSRDECIDHLRRREFDVLILGGGINGAGVARDLALRAETAGAPLQVALVEQNHFASGTSGRNSQLIHGGLRYLKYFEFRLVHEALRERAILLELAPHLVARLPFLIPMYSHFARVFYGTGLWLYDVLAGERSVGKHRQVGLDELQRMEPGLSTEGLVGGAVFYDCRVNSARFVLENLFDAYRRGVSVANYVRAESWERAGGGWQVLLHDRMTGQRFTSRAKQLVDTRGPWGGEGDLRLVRGSHIVLRRLNASDCAIAHFDDDGRIVFLIPWGSRRELTLVGTTDVDHDATPDEVAISEEEIRYLLGIVSHLYPSADQSIISSYSALRPLMHAAGESPTAASREHRIWVDGEGIVRVTGGKYTTYRQMSEEAASLVTERVAPGLTALTVTARVPLSGNSRGALAESDDAELAEYGVNAPAVRTCAPSLDRARIRFAILHEMARRLADVLFVSTYWGYERRWDHISLAPFAREMADTLGWSGEQLSAEIDLALRLCGGGRSS